MTEFATLSEVLNRLSGGNSGNPEALFIHKSTDRISGGSTFTLGSGGKMYSGWMLDGGNPGSGVAPTTAAVPTSATRGAVAFTNASGGREKRIICASFAHGPASDPSSDSIGDIILYDRLLHCGNLSGTTTGAQNVQSGSGVVLTRHTSGVGNEIWMEVYGTAIGNTPQTVTCSYTNQAGTSGHTTQAVPVAAVAATGAIKNILEVCRLPLQAGDTGVQSVETLTLSGSTGSAGVFGVTIANRIAEIQIHDGVGMFDFTYGDAGTYVIEDNACLAFMWRPTTNTQPPLMGVIATAER